MDARQAYAERASELPMLIHSGQDGQTGFLSLLRHTPHHAEIYVMGVLPTHRRQGIGRQLVQAAASWCLARDIRFLSVKTLDASVRDDNYGQTRAFYAAMGFDLFEVLPGLWRPNAPCAVFLMDLVKENRR
ncbi:MAG: GNAT family N-acetyltransferase [Pseudomonadota bacterium]